MPSFLHSRRNSPRRSRTKRRRLFERLEQRQLLAGDTLFTDSFESGSNSNDWVGNWVEDSQNDWFRSTQRATDGVRSAEVDGRATNATLTLANPVDLSGYSSAELTFDWLIESGFDSGEYLTLDVSSDGGSSWTSDVRRLSGNSSPENSWQNETVDLTPYASSNLLIRFRSLVSRWNEDANVDNVKITGESSPVGPPELISYWAAEGNAVDSQGSNDGVAFNGASFGTGQVGDAFHFDGVNDGIDVEDSPSLALTESMTIETWVRVDSFPNAAHGLILFRGDDRGGLDPYMLRVNSDGTIQFQINNAASETATVIADMPADQFTHVAATLDDATGEMKLYLNSVLVASTTTTVRPFGALDPASNPSVGIGNHGGFFGGTPHNFAFNGAIDELKLYDIPLSQADVLSSFEATKGNLAPTLSILDTTVVEGEVQFNFVEDFISPDAGGMIQPRGISYGPDGNLYISSSQTDSILRYDGSTGAFIDVFVNPGSGGLDDPRGLEFRDGYLLVTSSRSDAVLRFDASDGSFVDEFISAGSGGLIRPRDLLFGSNNDLYVASANVGDSVLRYNATTGEFIDEFISFQSGGLDNPTGIAIGPDGNFYVASTSSVNSAVLRYSPSGEYIDDFVQNGTGGLDGPVDLLFDESDGLLYVSGARSGTIHTYDMFTGDYRGNIGTVGRGALAPSEFLLDGDGDLLVTDVFGNSVKRFAKSSQANFEVELSTVWNELVTVDFATADESAMAGEDYLTQLGSIEFEPGELRRAISVPIFDDGLAEPTETLSVNISNAVGATITDATSTGTIIDDDVIATISYPDFSDTTKLNLIGDAVAPVGANDALRLTPQLARYSGGAWHNEPQVVAASFETEFEFQFGASGTDGFAFVIQNDTDWTFGGLGGGLGYDSIPNSLAIEFDTLANSNFGDPINDHVAVHSRGVAPNSTDSSAVLATATPSFDINDGQLRHVRVVYEPGMMSVFLEQSPTPTLTVPVDLAEFLDLDAGRAWLGFTGISGGTGQSQDILSWTFSNLADTSTSIDIHDGARIEGDSDAANLSFTVTRTGDVSNASSVLWATSDGSATLADNDYQSASGQLAFAPGETAKTISVSINGDQADESNEEFFVTLSSAEGGFLGDRLASGTIQNDDATITVAASTAQENGEDFSLLGDFVGPADPPHPGGTRNLAFGPNGDLYVSTGGHRGVLRFDGQTGAPLGVFAAADALALAKVIQFGPDGNLYVTDNVNNSVVRFDGTTGEFIDVFVSSRSGGLFNALSLAFDPDGDLYVASPETNEILRYNGANGSFVEAFVSAGTGGLMNPSALLFHGDHLYVASGTGTGGRTILRFDAATGDFVDVFVPESSGGLGFVADGGLTFARDVDGDGTQDLWISSASTNEILVYNGLTGDFIESAVGLVFEGVDGPIGHTFGADGNLYVLGFADSRVRRFGVDSQAAFVASLSSPSGVPVSFDFSAADGSAVAGADFAVTDGTLTFAPGVTSRTIIVPTIDDGLAENTETFQVDLSNALGAILTTTQATGTILDDGDVSNQPPSANAGADQSLSDDDGTGSEIVTLVGSGSDADGSVASYRWTEGTNVLGNTASISPSLSVGTHTLTLTVTDDGGATDSDDVVVTIAANQGPTANAGDDKTVTDADDNGSETISLTGSGSDTDGSIVAYQWTEGTTLLGNTATISPSLSVGTHMLTLTVTDNGGASATDTVTVVVEAAPSGPNLSHGDIASVGSSWQTVTLDKSYTSMVVMATPRYNIESGPGVVRISNVTSNSFDVRIDNVGSSAFSGGVHYVAVEEGVYDEAGQYKLEAVKYSEAETSRKNGWLIDSASYQQAYTNPVVVGQVMSANDPDWSVFWASSNSRTSPPTSSQLNVGKHVAEDPDTARATETVGYIVIEATQNGTIEGLPFVAGVGADTVRGVGNGTYQYSYTAMPNAKAAILSTAGMDGGDGGWAVLRGTNPLPPAGGTIDLAIEEDQLGDSERNHTTEQVAYFVIDPPLPVDPMDINGDAQVTAADALRVINRLARTTPSSTESKGEWESLDVNQDGYVSALDALVVINRLSKQPTTQAIAPIASAEAVDAIFAATSDDDEAPEAVDQLLASTV